MAPCAEECYMRQPARIYGSISSPSSPCSVLYRRLAWRPTARSSDGNPRGAYTLVAVDGQVPQDLRNPEAQARLSSGGAEVKIVKDTGVSVDLELRSLEGAKP